MLLFVSVSTCMSQGLPNRLYCGARRDHVGTRCMPEHTGSLKGDVDVDIESYQILDLSYHNPETIRFTFTNYRLHHTC